MPEKLWIGRQGGAVEPMGEPLRSMARRTPGGKEETEAARADRVDLSPRMRTMAAAPERLEALAAQLERRRYFIPAEVLSRKLLEEHLAGEEFWRSLAAR